jgi:ATP phosphoribosyltransferase
MKLAIALPTGALQNGALELMSRAGVADLDAGDVGRRLLHEQGGVRVVFVRPSDVPAYVDHGAVDLGVVGKDVLWEQTGGHYELVDLGFGACRLVVAVADDSQLRGPETWPPLLSVATKYPRATTVFMAGLGQAVEIVRLNGSVELAPQVGLADAIVDLTSSGRTLRDNRLRVVAEVGKSTARLIANQASLKTRSDAMQEIVSRIRRAVERAA